MANPYRANSIPIYSHQMHAISNKGKPTIGAISGNDINNNNSSDNFKANSSASVSYRTPAPPVHEGEGSMVIKWNVDMTDRLLGVAGLTK
jgi:hypothetical protein